MPAAIRVLIADDHAVVREGLRGLINSEPEMEVVGETVDGIEVVLQARALQPDVILMDLVMPRQDGLQAITEIREENPQARILVLTSFADDDMVFPAIKRGALGYLLKDSSPQELLRAIRAVAAGESSLHPTIARKVLREISEPSQLPRTAEPLSQREVQVLQLVTQGLYNEEIAGNLHITERTVRTHVSSILSKLHLANRTQAALYALKEGIVSLDDI